MPILRHRLRVLSVIDSLAPGGAERSLVDLVAPLGERGVAVDIAVLHDRPGLADAARAAGAQVVTVGAPAGPVATLGRLRTQIRANRPDVVHTTLFESHLVGRPAAALSGVALTSSLVSTPYGADQQREVGLRPASVRGAQLLDATTARLVRRFHVPAPHIADTMSSRLGVSRRRFDVVPRGRDAQALGRRTVDRRQRARHTLGLGEQPVALAVGRQVPLKGFDVAITALSRWPGPGPRPRLLIAGREDRATDELTTLVRTLGLGDDVAFLGERDDVADLLCAADVVVLPSRREGFPGVLVEALALETPIVASDLPGVRDVAGPDVGVLVSVGDPDELAAGLATTLEYAEAARHRAEVGRVRFERNFTMPVVADAMASFFERAAGSR